MKKWDWNDLRTGQRSVLVALAAVQLALAVAAWTDLATRPANTVAGRKGLWAAIIGINFVGPIAYFTRGRLQPRP